MSPVVIVLADHNPLLVPLLAFPVASVHMGAKATLRNLHMMETKNQELAELNQMKDDFVAMVSHELRTPLTSIQGGVKTLLRLGGDMPHAERKALLEAADRQSERLRQLIERLLVVAQAEAVAPRGDATSTVTLRNVAAHVVFDLQGVIRKRAVHLNFEPPDLQAELQEGDVHQILSNLVENALKYSDPSGPITVRGRAERGAVVIAVEDRGPGIPKHCREQIFERFYQVDQSRTREVGGTGLGLFISRKIARAMGGELSLDDGYKGGCRFVLRIPVPEYRVAEQHPDERAAVSR
jgi:signal transduction histidine kinase